MRVLAAILVSFFLSSRAWSGPPKWVVLGVEGCGEKWVRISIEVKKYRFEKILSQDSGSYMFVCEIKVKKKRRFFPDRVVKHRKVERKLKKDEVRGVWVLKGMGSSESIYKNKESALPSFLSKVVFRLKRKYFERKKYSVRGKVLVMPRIPRFPLSRFFVFGDKVDSGWFKIKLKLSRFKG